MHKAQRLYAIRGTAPPPLHYKHAGTARAKGSAGHAARRPEGELINVFLLPTPPRTWHRRAGGQPKARATTIKADLEPLIRPRVFGHARWRKDWVKVSSELAQDRRARSAPVRDVVNAIADADSTRPG